jgi:hypothetical protein
VAMGSIHGVPKTHLRRLRKNWRRRRQGMEEPLAPTQVRPEAVQTAMGVMGSALGMTERPGWVRELWQGLVKKEKVKAMTKVVTG